MKQFKYNVSDSLGKKLNHHRAGDNTIEIGFGKDWPFLSTEYRISDIFRDSNNKTLVVLEFYLEKRDNVSQAEGMITYYDKYYGPMALLSMNDKVIESFDIMNKSQANRSLNEDDDDCSFVSSSLIVTVAPNFISLPDNFEISMISA